MDMRTTEVLNYRADELAEQIAAATRKGRPAEQIGELTAIRAGVLAALYDQALTEHAARGHARPLASWSDTMLRDELRNIAHALQADDGEHYDSLMNQDRMVRNEITFRGAMSSF